MSGPRIELVKWGLAPGSMIQGRVLWDRRELQPEMVEVRLFWHTAGAGGKDQGAPIQEQFPVGAGLGELAFSMMAPNGPYSFSGKLLSIVWTIEVVVATQSVREMLVIGPGGREVVVGHEAS